MKGTIDARRLAGPDNALAQILSKYDDKYHSGFITRLDRTPVSRKKLLFLRSFIYNLVILSISAALMVFILRSFTLSISKPIHLTFNVTQGLLLLWATCILVFSTSIPFLVGECRVRWKYGFRPAEVVVRRSPPESSLTTRNKLTAEGHWHASLRAINPALLYSNPTSILSSDFWVMEYAVILDIYASMEKDNLNEGDLEFAVWKECGGVWTGLELWRLQSIISDQQEVALFKSFLISNEKHELLSIWESLFGNAKGAVMPTFEKYQSMVKRFSQEGVEYDVIWSQIPRHRFA